MFSNLSIRLKFVASFGAILLLTLVLGIISYIGFAKVTDEASFIKDDVYAKAVLGNSMLRRGIEVELLAYQAALAQDLGEIDAIKKK